MKIVHLCLSAFYIEGFGYQGEYNPKYNKRGHDVTIIASDLRIDVIMESQILLMQESILMTVG